jgi:enoyl-CoA hydratase
MQPSTIPHVLFKELPAKHGRIGLIILNRPKALNALSAEIVVDMAHKLHQWAQDPEIYAVVVRGDGERAFSAGGDLKELYNAGREKREMATPFFRQEYRLNEFISRFPKPYIPLLHGITMGGGLGISLHGTHVVAAEDLKMAMPETGIGFYPDTGGSFFLSHAPHFIGKYMGLTGNAISVADAILAGLVDQQVPRDKFDALIQALCDEDLRSEAGHVVTRVIDKFKVTPGTSALQEQLKTLETCFSHKSVQAIMDSLDEQNTIWAAEQLSTLNKRSPTSLKVTHRAISLAVDMDIPQCMEMEFNLTTRILEGHDIYEGIRAVLIDKTHNPQWQPDCISDVSDAAVAEMFELKCKL